MTMHIHMSVTFTVCRPTYRVNAITAQLLLAVAGDVMVVDAHPAGARHPARLGARLLRRSGVHQQARVIAHLSLQCLRYLLQCCGA